MGLPSTLANCIIDGNSIDVGFSTTNGSNITSYTYPSLLLTNADCKITSNNFAAITSNASSGIMASINNCSCEIQSNYFVRGSSSLLAYIQATGTTDNTIIDNIFDGYTTDGTNTSIVLGLTNTSQFTRNKNQTQSIYISLDEIIPNINNSANYQEYSVDDSSPPAVIVSNPNSLSFKTGSFATLTSFSDSLTGTIRTIKKKVCLSNILPDGVKILEAKQGLWMSSSNSVDTANKIFLSVERTVSDSFVLDARTLAGGPTFELDSSNIYNDLEMSYPSSGTLTGANLTNLQSNTQFIDLDLKNYLTLGDLTQYFVTNRLKPIFLQWLMNWKTTSGTTQLYLSAIQITYRW